MGVVRLRRDGVRDVKGDILNSAKQLFLDEGYERVSVDMILHDAGASKGSFYHYFNSKEDLIDVLIKKMLDPVYSRISGIVSSSMDAVAKLNESFSIAYHWRSDNAKLLNFLLLSFWNESNLVLRNKMRKWCMERDRALLVQIIDQGIDEGVFSVQDSEDVAELIVYMGAGVWESVAALFCSEGNFSDFLSRAEKKVALFDRTLAAILGLNEGSVKSFDLGGIASVLTDRGIYP
ncbi:MAG: TetR/AcrR family transcriptional regulator [Synergistales bacterium]|nr:TetR/AcrR family transcriptional regulator [Synergistales bacterium]